MEMRKINYKLEKFLTNFFGCPEGCFFMVWVSKKTPRRPAGEDHDYQYQQSYDPYTCSQSEFPLTNVICMLLLEMLWEIGIHSRDICRKIYDTA